MPITTGHFATLTSSPWIIPILAGDSPSNTLRASSHWVVRSSLETITSVFLPTLAITSTMHQVFPNPVGALIWKL